MTQALFINTDAAQRYADRLPVKRRPRVFPWRERGETKGYVVNVLREDGVWQNIREEEV